MDTKKIKLEVDWQQGRSTLRDADRMIDTFKSKASKPTEIKLKLDDSELDAGIDAIKKIPRKTDVKFGADIGELKGAETIVTRLDGSVFEVQGIANTSDFENITNEISQLDGRLFEVQALVNDGDLDAAKALLDTIDGSIADIIVRASDSGDLDAIESQIASLKDNVLVSRAIVESPELEAYTAQLNQIDNAVLNAKALVDKGQLDAAAAQISGLDNQVLDVIIKAQGSGDLGALENRIAALRGSIVDVKLQVDGDEQLDDIEQSLSGVETAAVTSGAALGKIAAPVGLAVGIREIVGTLNDFDTGLREVATLLPGLDTSGFEQLRQEVIDVARETNNLPEDIIPALYNALSAGVPRGNVFDFIEQANKGAVAGVTDINTAVNALTSVVNSYGADVISAAEASDIIFTTIRLGKTTFSELEASIGDVLPTAKAANISFDEVGGSLALLTARGLSTPKAVTALNTSLSEIQTPTSKLAVAFREIAGVSIPEFIASGGSLIDVLGVLKQAADETDGGFAALSSQEAAKALNVLTSDLGETSKFLDATALSAGATDEAFKQVAEGSAFALRGVVSQLTAAFLEATVTLTPLITGLANGAAGLLAFLDNAGLLTPLIITITSSLTVMAVALAGVAAAAVPISAPVLAVAAGVGAMVLVFQQLEDRIGGVKAFLATLLLFTPVIGILASIIAGLTTLANRVLERFGGITGVLRSGLDLIVRFATGVRDAFTSLIGPVQTFAAFFIDIQKNAIGPLLNLDVAGFLNVIGDAMFTVGETIGGFTATLFETLGELGPKVFEQLVDVTTTIVRWAATDLAPAAIDVAGRFATAFIDGLGALISELPGWLARLVTVLLGWRGVLARIAVEQTERFVSGFLSGFTGLPVSVREKLGEIVNEIPGALSNLLSSVGDGLSGLGAVASEQFEAFKTAALDVVENLPGDIADGLGDLGSVASEKFEEFKTAAIDALKSLPGDIGSLLDNIFGSAGSFDLGELVSDLPQQAADLAANVGQFLGEVVATIIGASIDLVVSAASRIGELVPIIVGVLPVVAGAIGEKLGELFSGLGERIGGFISDLGERIGEAIPELGERIGEAFSGFSERVGEIFSGLGERVGEFFSNIGSAIADAASGIAEAAPEVAEKIGELIVTVGSFLFDSIVRLNELAAKGFLLLVAAIPALLSQAIPLLIDGIKFWATVIVPAVFDFGVSLLGELLKIVPQIPGFLAKIGLEILAFIPRMIAFGLDLVGSFVTGFITGLTGGEGGGGSLLITDALNTLIGNIKDFISNIDFGELLTTVGQTIVDFFVGMGENIVVAIQFWYTQAVPAIVEFVLGLLLELGKFALEIPGLLLDLGGLIFDGIKLWFTVAVPAIAEFVLGILVELGKLALQIPGLLVDLGGLIFEGIKFWFTTAAPAIAEFVLGIVTEIGKLALEIPGILLTVATAILDWIANLAVQAIAGAISFVDGFLSGLLGFDVKVGETLTNIINAVTDWVANLLTQVTEFKDRSIAIVTEWGTSAVNKFNETKDTVITTVTALKTLVVSLITQLKDLVLAQIDVLRARFTAGVDLIRATVSNGFETLRARVVSIITAMVSTVIATVDRWRANITSRVEAIRSSVTSTIDSLKSRVVTSFNQLRNEASSAVESFRSKAVSAFNAIKSPIDSLIDKVNAAISAIKKIPSSISLPSVPSVPSFSGFTGRAGADGLVVTGPEVVLLGESPKGGREVAVPDHLPLPAVYKLLGQTNLLGRITNDMANRLKPTTITPVTPPAAVNPVSLPIRGGGMVQYIDNSRTTIEDRGQSLEARKLQASEIADQKRRMVRNLSTLGKYS